MLEDPRGFVSIGMGDAGWRFACCPDFEAHGDQTADGLDCPWERLHAQVGAKLSLRLVACLAEGLCVTVKVYDYAVHVDKYSVHPRFLMSLTCSRMRPLSQDARRLLLPCHFYLFPPGTSIPGKLEPLASGSIAC